jgi:hypothetical protein
MAQDAVIQSEREVTEAVTEAPGIANRRHQMFPTLSPQEIDRIRRFGQVLHYPRGDRLFAAGQLRALILRVWLETSVPAPFAVGDVRSGSVKRVGGVIGDDSPIPDRARSGACGGLRVSIKPGNLCWEIEKVSD